MQISNLLFELIQSSVGMRTSLSFNPTDEEWMDLFLLAKKQALIGIIYQGIENLEDKNQLPNRNIRMSWFMTAEKIKKRNHFLDQKCIELQSMLSGAGFRSSILKGQGLAKHYNDGLQSLRSPGDIDIYVDCGREKALAYAKSLGQSDINWDYKHLHLRIWENTSIELHYRVEIVLNPFKNIRLQRWFDENKDMLFDEDGKMVAPSITMNLFYILLHMYCHFFGSGIGMKQLIDYLFVVRSANGHFGCFHHGETINDVLRKFGMSRFAGGIMWLLSEVAGLERSYMYCSPYEKEGRYILNEMLLSGNLGKYDQRVKQFNHMGKVGDALYIFKHNAHLFRMYPQDALMSPLWYVWHKAWMIKNK
jgi:hypothetical protein